MEMDGQEFARLIEALEHLGLSAEEILNLIQYVGTGDARYLPKSRQ